MVPWRYYPEDSRIVEEVTLREIALTSTLLLRFEKYLVSITLSGDTVFIIVENLLYRLSWTPQVSFRCAFVLYIERRLRANYVWWQRRIRKRLSLYYFPKEFLGAGRCRSSCRLQHDRAGSCERRRDIYAIYQGGAVPDRQNLKLLGGPGGALRWWQPKEFLQKPRLRGARMICAIVWHALSLRPSALAFEDREVQ